MSGDTPDPGATLSEAWANLCREVSEGWRRGLAEAQARRQAPQDPAVDRLRETLAEAGPRLQEAVDTATLRIADALADARARLAAAEDDLRWQVARPRDTDPT